MKFFWRARTSARAARQNILRIHSKMAKKRIFIQILARAEVRARQIFFSEMESPKLVDEFCTLNECLSVKIDN